MTPADARRAAHRDFGGVEQAKQLFRDHRGLPPLENLIQDLRYGWRMLRKSSALTAGTILSLALGIGANTTIFTIVDTVMLKMLPVRNPTELIQLSRYYQDQRSNFSYP
jgi:hypothetical protein